MSQIAHRPSRVVDRAREMLGDRGRAVAGSHVHVVGVAYKPGVADVRESPALEIIEQLSLSGARVTFDDPLVDSVRIGSDTMSRSRTSELEGRPDLILVHTRPVGMDLAELEVADAVLDATFELRDLEHREVV